MQITAHRERSKLLIHGACAKPGHRVSSPGTDPAACQGLRPQRTPTSSHSGVEDAPVLVRVRRRRQEHSGAGVAAHGHACRSHLCHRSCGILPLADGVPPRCGHVGDHGRSRPPVDVSHSQDAVWALFGQLLGAPDGALPRGEAYTSIDDMSPYRSPTTAPRGTAAASAARSSGESSTCRASAFSSR